MANKFSTALKQSAKSSSAFLLVNCIVYLLQLIMQRIYFLFSIKRNYATRNRELNSLTCNCVLSKTNLAMASAENPILKTNVEVTHGRRRADAVRHPRAWVYLRGFPSSNPPK